MLFLSCLLFMVFCGLDWTGLLDLVFFFLTVSLFLSALHTLSLCNRTTWTGLTVIWTTYTPSITYTHIIPFRLSASMPLWVPPSAITLPYFGKRSHLLGIRPDQPHIASSPPVTRAPAMLSRRSSSDLWARRPDGWESLGSTASSPPPSGVALPYPASPSRDPL